MEPICDCGHLKRTHEFALMQDQPGRCLGNGCRCEKYDGGILDLPVVRDGFDIVPIGSQPDPVYSEVNIEVKGADGTYSHWAIPKAKNLVLTVSENPFTRVQEAELHFEPEGDEEGVWVHQRTTPEEPHDEYHTMSELYYYRMLYNAYAAKLWYDLGFPVVKSVRHSDGEVCFGGEYFIVVAELPTGQVSNHYKIGENMANWNLFNVPIVDKAPEWDGHSPDIAADRMHRYLQQVIDPTKMIHPKTPGFWPTYDH